MVKDLYLALLHLFIYLFIFLIDSPSLVVIDGLVSLRFNFLPTVERLFVIHNKINTEILLKVWKMLKEYNMQSGVLYGVYHTSNLTNKYISGFYIENINSK